MNLLIADIGGTNARFAFQKRNKDNINFINYYRCKDYHKIDDAIEYYIKKNKLKVDNMALSIAGPCNDNYVSFSNNHWWFEKIKLSKKFNVKSLLVVNDFVAQAFAFENFFKLNKSNYSKNLLEKYKIKLIKDGIPVENTNLLVTGPGTGLGVCTLTKANNIVVPIAGEGGNVNFSPQNENEIELLEFLLNENNYVSTEDVVSGRGLENIHKFLQYKNNKMFNKLDAKQIGNLALGNDELAQESIKLMLSIFGTSVSNNILTNGCQKGVIIAGGIISKLRYFLDKSDFFKNLINKGGYKKYLDNVPIFLAYEDHNGLIGCLNCYYNKYFAKFKTILDNK